MFIQLELWDEEPRENAQPVRFGALQDAYLNMHELKYRHLPINIHCIQSFEAIRIWTTGRPGTSENKTDTLNGIRILLADGSKFIVIDDKDPSFEAALVLASQNNGAIFDFGQSDYMRRFKQ